MGIQEVLMGLLFLAATIYIGRIIYKNFRSKKSCGTGCGKCGVDFTDVEIKKNA
jgi:bacterioferritin-associated ferredoxin